MTLSLQDECIDDNCYENRERSSDGHRKSRGRSSGDEITTCVPDVSFWTSGEGLRGENSIWEVVV